MGRETALQKKQWTEDGWIRLSDGGNEPFLQVELPQEVEVVWKLELERDDFDSKRLNI